MSETEINGLKIRISKVEDWINLSIISGNDIIYTGEINNVVLKDKEELISVVRDIAKMILEGKAFKLNHSISLDQEHFEKELVKKLLER